MNFRQSADQSRVSLKLLRFHSAHFIRASVSALVLAAIAVVTGPIHSARADPPSCDYDPASHRVTITSAERTRTIIQRTGSEDNPGSVLQFGLDGAFQPCDGATVHNTDLIVFVDVSERGKGWLEISQRHGAFVPGRTVESRGKSEIEFSLDQSGDPELRRSLALEFTGGDRPDTITGGRRGLKLNGDGDIDVHVRSSKNGYFIASGRGDDEVFLDGRGGTGVFSSDVGHTHIVDGGSGDDLLVGDTDRDALLGLKGDDRIYGLRGEDRLDGGPGRDRVWGQKGADRIRGSDHADHVIGGDGGDAIYGEASDDHLEGSSGDDQIFGGDGADHLDGDSGIDRCSGGPARDTREDCESS